jgi:hypothetical protein
LRFRGIKFARNGLRVEPKTNMLKAHDHGKILTEHAEYQKEIRAINFLGSRYIPDRVLDRVRWALLLGVDGFAQLIAGLQTKITRASAIMAEY